MSKLPHRTKKLSNAEYIQQCHEMHGSKYSYEKTQYINDASNVIITCPTHGDFKINAGRFKRGCGCPKCVGKGLTKEDIVSLFRSVHKGKYDYSKMVFTKMNEKVEIICPIHGSFFQTPSKHKKGEGCPICGRISGANKKRKTSEKWISDAKKVHGNKYDYSKVEYKNPFTPITIICPIHGEFRQRPNDHLNGHGCPKCSSSLLENEIRELLNENNIKFEEQKKFDWLGKQSLDFFITDKNIAIECQGEQHFQPIEHFGGEIIFEAQKERDKRKLDLCTNHRIKLLYFAKNKINDEVITNKDELLKMIV